MTDYSVLDIISNGAGLQAYLRAGFVDDSAFPRALSDGGRVIAQPTEGGGLLLLPVEAVDEYPIAVDGPPDGLVADVADGAEVAAPDGDLCPEATDELHRIAIDRGFADPESAPDSTHETQSD
ncbi:hypothetical protein [Halosegnis longus]|uniref:hypothetical protein n=1 Tax=Halosegnis longus TaxID=2216012 RepID=UPI00129D2DC5|nr:hypothetical protein [Halosegnis longus]